MSGLNALVRGYSHRILVTFLSREATRRSLQPGREPSPHCAPAHAQGLIHVLLLCDPMDCSPPSSSVHGLSRQEYWSGLPFPSPGDLPNLGVKPASPALQVDSLPLSHQGGPTQLKWQPNSRLPASSTVRNMFLLFASHLLCGVLSQQPEPTKRLGLSLDHQIKLIMQT